jgi:hypothetical protein
MSRVSAELWGYVQHFEASLVLNSAAPQHRMRDRGGLRYL